MKDWAFPFYLFVTHGFLIITVRFCIVKGATILESFALSVKLCVVAWLISVDGKKLYSVELAEIHNAAGSSVH